MKKTTTILTIMLALGFLTAGCGDEFLPPSYLDGLRVLALVSDPVEAGPYDEVRITPAVYLPPDETLNDQSWTFCPFSLGPTTGYECALPACETQLTPEIDGSVQASPGALALQCVAELTGEEAPGGVPSELPEKADVYFRYRATASSGETGEAVFKLALWTQGPPSAPNRPPLFESVEVDGRALSAGETADPVAAGGQVQVRVRIDPDSLDPFVDDAGRSRTEEAIISLYATAGRFEFDRIAGEDASVVWKSKNLEPGQTQADIYVVARDLRGGQAVFGPVFVPLLR
jgi:hypothetical protein